ncbi:hypothetical protein FRACA_180013 [Frankia canadensis]|uniref:Uncharacterized protein n=1 Tax=Frankia canadensis TaxID=1836972 RepID=A0A2I2KNN4_9ACTN|nr:hypothetical protein FRACA_180013 [Frankia canadensis]SOU54539.1 hypothetical protein FRACA_180013 [Frankia canadensis]
MRAAPRGPRSRKPRRQFGRGSQPGHATTEVERRAAHAGALPGDSARALRSPGSLTRSLPAARPSMANPQTRIWGPVWNYENEPLCRPIRTSMDAGRRTGPTSQG